VLEAVKGRAKTNLWGSKPLGRPCPQLWTAACWSETEDRAAASSSSAKYGPWATG